MSREPPLEVKVWGPLANFTRPEFSAERVSYEVMTPGAARGILERIFWKPEMTWRVREIHVLEPIRHYSILRNEMNSLQSDRSARAWAANGEGHYYADDDRAQRHMLCLRDVVYIIKADIVLKPHANENVAKYRDQFRRRVKRGQCFSQPYLGTRECTAHFGKPEGNEEPIDHTDDLGLMLFDMEFKENVDGTIEYLRHDEQGARVVKGNAQPKFFRARLEKGSLYVPDLYGDAP